jgi:signal transduction histidine kinase
LGIRIYDIETAIELYQHEKTRQIASPIFRLGFSLILFVLYLAFYLFYPAKKANLYFSLSVLFDLFAWLIEINAPHEMKNIPYWMNTQSLNANFSAIFLFLAFYTILNEKRGWIFWSIMALTLLGTLLNIIQWGGIVSGVLGYIIYIEAFRLIAKAIRNKQKGAWIIAAGAISYIVFWALFLLGFPFGYSDKYFGATFTYADLFFNLATLSIPVAISIYLGIDFAITNKSLSKKLLEVNELSRKNLEQQREKQQLLASQNETLEQQVTERTYELKRSLENLKLTQAQLIYSEKMASLGELTAGIAHEIQNPLNFVNNFSEVNKELLIEMKDEINKGNTDEVKAIANDVIDNEEKIHFHGKRADAIVKGMLQHSRTSKVQKEPTDINALADEYLRLSYHGLRAKDKEFNGDFRTNFDEGIGKIDVVPQDIGRVLLNLYNNAFYSVNEKKKKLNGAFEPTVEVSTRRVGNKVELSVKDNGIGIPQEVVDKIFQPFFTTKPTGQGTGLGLSLSYDVINAHGGEIKVDSKVGEGTEFVVVLPLKKLSEVF